MFKLYGPSTWQSVLRHQGELEEAEGLLRRSIAIDREHLGSNHHFVGETLVNLAMLVRDRRGPADAEPIYREALDVYRVAYPEGFWVTALAQCRLGRCLVQLEEYVEAEALLEEGLELLRRDRGESSPQAEVCAQGLVELYEASSKPELAAAGDLLERGELEP